MKPIRTLLALCLMAACSKADHGPVKTVIVPFHWVVVMLAFFVTSAITRFDTTAFQAVRRGDVPPDTPLPRHWLGMLYYVHWGLLIALLLFAWRLATVLFVIKTVLSFLGLLDIVGALLVAPFTLKRK